MFFQAINQMITAGTDLSINIRRVNSNLTVAVVPRRSGVKDGERIVPLILNGTPEELDAGFLQAVGTPVQKAQGILTNLETFEKQAEQAVSQSKAARSAAEKESKEVREKREKMEKLLKKAEDAMTGKRYSEALTWLKQAKVLALPDKQKEIDEKMAEVQKKASEGSLFGMEQPPMSKPQPAPQQTASQPAAAPAPQYRSGEQIPMFLPEQPAPVPQPVSQPQPPRSVVHPGQQTPFTGQPQTQSVQYTISVPQAQPVPQQAVPQPQGIQFHQPVQMQQARIDEKQWMQPAPPQPRYAPVQEAARTYEEREYFRQPQEAAMYNFDKDCEDDREMLREDPYAEYPDFPKECRMTDMAQMDMVYC
ncbi:PRTRC system protein E [Phocaeicola vulgatus]|nr:PRTRC system protein E [Phocaeicola vulgatus]